MKSAGSASEPNNPWGGRGRLRGYRDGDGSGDGGGVWLKNGISGDIVSGPVGEDGCLCLLVLGWLYGGLGGLVLELSEEGLEQVSEVRYSILGNVGYEMRRMVLYIIVFERNVGAI